MPAIMTLANIIVFDPSKDQKVSKISQLQDSKLQALEHMAKNRANIITLTAEFLASSAGQEDTLRNRNLRKSQETLQLTIKNWLRIYKSSKGRTP